MGVAAARDSWALAEGGSCFRSGVEKAKLSAVRPGYPEFASESAALLGGRSTGASALPLNDGSQVVAGTAAHPAWGAPSITSCRRMAADPEWSSWLPCCHEPDAVAVPVGDDDWKLMAPLVTVTCVRGEL